jgi:3-phosphoshikimate 1-carboxyvinyltransferase
VEYELAGRRPDIKDALLLSGLYADEATYVREAIVSRDHLERMLQAIDVPVSAAGPIIFLDPAGWSGKIEAFSFDVPGDVGAATLLAGMATLVPGSRVCVRGVGLNATRTGVLDLLRQMGAERETTAEATRLGETEGTVCAAYAPLRAVPMTGELLLHARDDLPVLNALAATDAFVESVSARGMVDLLHAFGIEAVSPDPDCIVVSGRPDEPLAAVDVDAEGGAARATTAIMLALLGNGPSRIRDADALAERFPRVVGTLRALGVDVRVEQRG